jgi:gas vesicle protein
VRKKPIRDVTFLAVGIGIGSAIALLLAPGSGEEVRYAISRGYRKTAKNIGRHTEDLRDRAEGLLEHAQSLRELGSKLFHIGRAGSRAA